MLLKSAIEAKNLQMENKKNTAKKRPCYDSRFQNLEKTSNWDHLGWKDIPSKETEEVYRPAQELSSQLNPVEDGLANTFSRTHRIGQALTGPKSLSKQQTTSSASLENWYSWHSTNVTNRTHCQRNLEVHMNGQDIPGKLFIQIVNSRVYQQWFFKVTTIISFW